MIIEIIEIRGLMSLPILNETKFNQILEEWKNLNRQDDNEYLIDSINGIFRQCYNWGERMTELCPPMVRDHFVTVQTLPQELFCYPPFNKYREIDLSNWGVHEIPESIFLNLGLEALDLSQNPITSVSKNIAKLKNLNTLKISNTNVTSLPEEIDELSNLSCLEISNNQFNELPSSLGNLQNLVLLNVSNNRGDLSHSNDLPRGLLASLQKLKNLEFLALARNRLEELPIEFAESLESMEKLHTLDLSNNGLRVLPENLDFFTKLKSLYSLILSENSLSEIPSDFFTSLKDLEDLCVINLANNRLTTLPDNFRELPRQKRLILSGNHFSSEEVERILTITREPGYNGPIIDLSIQDRMIGLEKDSGIIISELCQIAKLPQKQLHLSDSLELKSWLNRIAEIPEFNSETNKQILAKKIIRILEEASINPSFKQVFYGIIVDASETCGDRVALSILHLDIQHRLENMDLSDMPKLASFLSNGVWTLDLLEKCARNKVETLAGVDEIETYLAYPIYLKEALDIPIVQEDMLYFRCSGVSDEDLQEAKNFVLEHRDNKEKQLEFLLSQEKWIEALRINHPEKMQQIESERESLASEDNLDADAYSKIQEEYQAKLLNLSKAILMHDKAI